MAFRDGDVVAGYRIVHVLGRGGMGVVYEAKQLSLNRTVALKFLSAHFLQDVDFRERFRREGVLQAGIDHPHIVPVYEAGEVAEGLFLAMRLVRGPNLKELIAGGDLEPARAVAILAQVADALDAAHRTGLTHRDIKPQNILVGEYDHGYLADFGLTKGSDVSSITRTGQFLGTLDYIAPEQINGEFATPRSDIYSLAAVLHESLTGSVPYPRPAEAAVLFAHVTEPPPRVTDRRPDLPDGLDDVIAWGMAKLPSQRPESARALLDVAAEALGSEASSATAAPARPARRAPSTRPKPVAVEPTAAPTEVAPPLATTTEHEVRAATGTELDVAAAATSTELEVVAPDEHDETVEPGAVTADEPDEETVEAAADLADERDEETVEAAADLADERDEETVEAAADLADEPDEETVEAAADLADEPDEETVEAAVDLTDERDEARALDEPEDETVVSGAVAAGEPELGERQETLEPGADEPERTVWQPLSPSTVEEERVTEPIGSDADETARLPRTTRTADAGAPRRRLAPAALGGAVLLAAAVAAGLLGGGSGERDAAPPAAAPESLALSAGPLALRGPEGWTAREAPPIAGLGLREPAAAGNGESTIVAGTTAAEGPALLPADFAQRLPSPPRPEDAVTLGAARAYRFADLRPEGSDGAMTLLVAPTSAGVATIVCLGTDVDRARCEAAAGSLELDDGVRVLRLGPSAQYARALKAPLDRLRTRRAAALRDLDAADTPGAQARHAATIAAAYRKAAAALGKVEPNPPERPVHAALRRAVARAGQAYGSVADAAGAERRQAYERAGRRARTADRDLNQALEELEAFGYRVR